MILRKLKERFRRALADLVDESQQGELLDLIRPSGDPQFGDYQANFAMPLAKRLGRSPRQLAAEVNRRWSERQLGSLEIVAGPHFWPPANVGFYSPQRPRVYGYLDPQLNPWCSDEEVRRRGILVPIHH